MPGVRIHLGDMFHGPSDVVVLPCSTIGSVTREVWRRLKYFSLPAPPRAMAAGHVEFVPLKGGESIAQYAAYAASVHVGTTSERTVRGIAEKLGGFTREMQAARRVKCPLLGAGAGGLDAEASARGLIRGFMDTAAPEAVLELHVLAPEVYQRLREEYDTEPPPDHAAAPRRTPPRVFLSYAHTSESHRAWVLDLARFLRQNGVDARLDQWHLRHGMDMPQFMVNELRLADRVILVTDEMYAERADSRVGGVGWETMIVQGDLYTLPADNCKYLVLVRSQDVTVGLPLFLRTRFVIHWPPGSSEPDMRELLLREVYQVPLAPPLGQAPAFLIS